MLCIADVEFLQFCWCFDSVTGGEKKTTQNKPTTTPPPKKNSHKEQPQTLKHAKTILPTPTICTLRNSVNQAHCIEENKLALFHCFPDYLFHAQCSVVWVLRAGYNLLFWLMGTAACPSACGWLVSVQCCAPVIANLVLMSDDGWWALARPGSSTLNSQKHCMKTPKLQFWLFVLFLTALITVLLNSTCV